MDNGCEKCAQVEGLCPECEIEMLEDDIARNMNRIEELKQKQKGEQDAKIQRFKTIEVFESTRR